MRLSAYVAYLLIMQHFVAQVEKAPIVLKAGVKKEEAEELQKKLEAGAIAWTWQPVSCVSRRSRIVAVPAGPMQTHRPTPKCRRATACSGGQDCTRVGNAA
jgi:hypothetical protein